MEIRKSIVSVEEVVTDGGKPLASPIHRATAVVVVKNPFAGRFVDDLSPLFDVGFEIGAMFTKRLVDLLGGPPVSYGKAAIVGPAGGKGVRGGGCPPQPRGAGAGAVGRGLSGGPSGPDAAAARA